MTKRVLLCICVALAVFSVHVPAQPSAPPLTPEEIVRLRAVKAWDIEFTYHFTDTRTGSGDIPPGVGCNLGGKAIDHWQSSHSNENQYVVKFTLAGKNAQSDCASGSDSCLTKYQYPGSITNGLETFSRFDEIHFINGCPEPPDGNLTGPGTQTLLQAYTVNADRILDGTGENRIRGRMIIDYGVNPPRASGIFDTPPVDYFNTTTFAGCYRTDAYEALFPSRIYIEIYLYDSSNSASGDTYLRIENGSFVVRGSSTQNEVFNATSSLANCPPYSYQSGGALRTTTREWIIREHIDSSITVTRPAADMFFVSGETEMIRWTTDVADSVKIYYSVDSGIAYTEMIDSIPAQAHEYLWNVPDTLLSRSCRIKVVSMRDTTRFGVSEIYKMKGYVLTVPSANGGYLAYDPAWDRWGIKNTSADVWPASWYARFNYSATDPFTGRQYAQWQGGGLLSGTFSSAQSSDHPDWPSFVNTFSVSACYVSASLGIYSPTALARWASIKGAWGGSCFGIAVSNAIVFRNSGAFWGTYPQYPFFAFPIQATPDTNTIPAINELFTHQFGNPHVAYRNTVAILKTPNQTLNDIKAMCLSDSAPVRTLGMLNNGVGGGGHAILAYKVKRDTAQAGLYNVYVYDNSWSDSTNAYLVIDTTLNGGQGGWSYSLWPGWGGSQWIYLRDPAITHLSTPTLPKIEPRDRLSPFIVPEGELELHTVSGAAVRIQDANGNASGYIDSLIRSDIPGSVPLVIENGATMPPAGYSLPTGSYSVELSNFKTSASSVFFFTGSTSMIVDRSDAQETQTDLLYFNGGVSIANHDAENKIIRLTDIINESVREKLFDLSVISMASGDSLAMTPLGGDGLMLTSFGSQKTFELEIVYSTDTGIARYKHGSVPLNSNTAYVYAPDWPALGTGDGLTVFVDEGNDGSVEDTLLLENQLTDARDKGELNVPDRFELFQNYPNPFNPLTVIRYQLPADNHVTLRIYDVLGRAVATLVNEIQDAGFKSVEWDGGKFPSGVYYCRLAVAPRDGGAVLYTKTRTMMLVK